MKRFATRAAVLLLVLVTGSWLQVATCQVACDAPAAAMSHTHAMGAQEDCCDGSSAAHKASSAVKCTAPAVWDVASSADHATAMRLAAQHAAELVTAPEGVAGLTGSAEAVRCAAGAQRCPLPLRI